MRIVLFYSEVESFNFFTDQLVNEFQSQGNETCVLDLRKPASYQELLQFASKKVDAVICFDGLGKYPVQRRVYLGAEELRRRRDERHDRRRFRESGHDDLRAGFS